MTAAVPARFLKGLHRQIAAYNESHTEGTVRVSMGEEDSQYVRVHVEVDVETKVGGVSKLMSKAKAKAKSESGPGSSSNGSKPPIVTHRIECSYTLAKPFMAPVVRYLTDNHVFQKNVPVCINGLTHYHEETFNATMSLEQVVDSVAAPLLDDGAARAVRNAIGALGVPH
jgi:hypothetical protein